MKPSTGRMVHYLSEGKATTVFKDGQFQTYTPADASLPAIVLAVSGQDDQRCLIRVLALSKPAADFNVWADFSEEPKAECWSWPPRV